MLRDGTSGPCTAAQRYAEAPNDGVPARDDRVQSHNDRAPMRSDRVPTHQDRAPAPGGRAPTRRKSNVWKEIDLR